MTDDEMIAIIQAHKDGKAIQSMPSNRDIDDWTEHKKEEWVDVPIFRPFYFNFYDYNYRIKPEPHYRPFKTADEVLAAIKEHGSYIQDGSTYRLLKKFTFAENGKIVYSFSGLQDRIYDSLDFRFVDRTPFGKLEE